MGDSFGTLGGHGRELVGPRGRLRGPREPQGSSQGGSGGAKGAPRGPRGGTWGPQGVPGASLGEFRSSNLANSCPELGHQELIDMIYQS